MFIQQQTVPNTYTAQGFTENCNDIEINLS